MTDLNPEQQAVVDPENRDGARCVIAGPGTGKTKTMVAFFKSLRDAGVPAANIRCVTFSKEAAAEIERRAGVKDVFSTFHSLGYQICSALAGHKAVEPELRHRLMCKLARQYGREYKSIDSFISQMRHANITPGDIEFSNYDYAVCRAYVEYERVRAQEGWMDFDSMLCDAVKLLEIPQNRAQYQYEYLIVDEAQDTDDLQWRMMQLLSEKYGNITVVGDPNQAIYAWRGAHPDNITHFERWFPNGRYFYLGRNYRSTQAIVRFVRENLPKDCPPELKEKMIPARDVAGVPLALKMYWTDDAEAESALSLAQVDPLNTVILARTNHILGLLERVSNRNNVAYHLLGRSGFWKQNEVRKAIEALKGGSTRLSLPQALSMALPSLEARYAVDDRTERDNDALQNLQTLRVIAKDFSNLADFLVYANKMVHRRNAAKGVTLSTVHQAKGGEWKNVFIVGANAKMMPHKNGDPIEEERIYLVAISRAVDRLRISWAGSPSPYLRRYLTEETLDRLRESADEVDRLQTQRKLFS